MRLRADRRAERRSEALSRNAAWQGLSIKEQIQALHVRPGASEKQLGRLYRQQAKLKGGVNVTP